jgi:hypothetical protein
MLESHQEATKFRRKATEQGFEMNVYVPLELPERKQQQRRQPNEQPDRNDVYELTQKSNLLQHIASSPNLMAFK